MFNILGLVPGVPHPGSTMPVLWEDGSRLGRAPVYSSHQGLFPRVEPSSLHFL